MNKILNCAANTTIITSFVWGFYNSMDYHNNYDKKENNNDKQNVSKFWHKFKCISKTPLTSTLNGSIMGAVYCFGASTIVGLFPITSLIIPPLIATSFIYDIVSTD